MVLIKNRYSCSKCDKVYSSIKWFEKHVCPFIKPIVDRVSKVYKKSNKSQSLSFSKKHKLLSLSKRTSYGSWIDVLSFEDDYWIEQDISLENDEILETYNEILSSFSKGYLNDLKILHININSVFSKVDSFFEILDSDQYDLLFINESKLNSSIPDSFICHKKYSCYRRDRDYVNMTGIDKNGGGIVIYIRKEYIHSVQKSDSFESMHLSLIIKNTTYNFIACYKSPSVHNQKFIEYLESVLMGIDLNDPLFIIGDLNMDLLSSNENPLKRFMQDQNMSNFINNATRVRQRFNKSLDTSTHSSTLLDVIIHNKNLITGTQVIDCPYSDHKFIVGAIDIKKFNPKPQIFWSRSLSEKNLKLMSEYLSSADFSGITNHNSVNDKWEHVRKIFIEKLDKIAPLKKVTLKSENKFPWFDLELYKIKKARDTSYAKAIKSKTETDWEIYKENRSRFHKSNRLKLINYFEKQGTKDFKNSKKFWDFYKSSVKIRSDKSNCDIPKMIYDDNDLPVIIPDEIALLFNNFFTSIESISITSNDECVNFNNKLFNKMKSENELATTLQGFSFRNISANEVKEHLNSLKPSSPGSSGISSKILKLVPDTLAPIFSDLFNCCIVTSKIPDDWKSAIVSPLFKNKGKPTNINNYRGISIISPIAKIFESILAKQITAYFEDNKLLTCHQHGFRRNHSCETALHELISDLNIQMSKRLTSLLLFIDFRKAFDTVDSKLLLTKLFHYGFNTSALQLIADYFDNRLLKTKLGNITSDSKQLLLGVPQGSILGPLFFLIFINDLLFFLTDIQRIRRSYCLTFRLV